LINGAEKLTGGEILKQKRAEALVSAAITAKIKEPSLGRFKTASEFRRSASDLAAPPAVFTPG